MQIKTGDKTIHSVRLCKQQEMHHYCTSESWSRDLIPSQEDATLAGVMRFLTIQGAIPLLPHTDWSYKEDWTSCSLASQHVETF